MTDAGLSSTWQCLAGFKQGNNAPVLYTSNSLLGQAPILHASVRPASQVTTEPNTVMFLEFSDSDTITSQFYEDDSVSFSDTPTPVTCQGSHVTPKASHLTGQAQRPSITQGNCSSGPRSSTLMDSTYSDPNCSSRRNHFARPHAHYEPHYGRIH